MSYPRPAPRKIGRALLALATILCLWIAPLSAGDPAPPAACEIQPGTGPNAKVEVVGVEGKGWLERRNGNLVLHLAGTPYEMGFQHGRLLRDKVRGLVQRVQAMATFEAARNPENAPLPKLQEAYKRCLPHIPADILEEMKGLADGSGVPLDVVKVTNMIPELFHCSGFALWGKATQDGALYHGRILDYAMEIGYHQFAVLIVAKPDGKHAFVNVGYAGFLGSVTGVNDRQISFGEMGGGGTGLWDGMPMAFLMRKGLEEADTLEEAVGIFRDTPRTCEYYYVIADAKIPDARGLSCTPERFITLSPGEVHPDLPVPVGLKDCVLMSADDRFRLLAARTILDYGKFDGPRGLALMRRPVAMKSAIHTTLVAPTLGKLWVSNAIGNTPSSECPYTEYDLRELFDASAPAPAPPAEEHAAATPELPVRADAATTEPAPAGALEPAGR